MTARPRPGTRRRKWVPICLLSICLSRFPRKPPFAARTLRRRDDPEFIDYYFEAESRLPERYFTPGLAEDGREGLGCSTRARSIWRETPDQRFAGTLA